MNYLAHLHLATLADSSLLGNLMADYVRGNPRNDWPDAVAEGILLHRRIDAMTDALPEVRAAKAFFRDETRRVAPITLDVIWDHFLSLNWGRLHPDRPLSEFLTLAEDEITPHLAGTPERFQSLNRYLWRERWMERYADPAWLERVLNGMARSRPRLATLAPSYYDFIDNYQTFSDYFWQLYPRMMELASQKAL